jgi:hypothetical protein
VGGSHAAGLPEGASGVEVAVRGHGKREDPFDHARTERRPLEPVPHGDLVDDHTAGGLERAPGVEAAVPVHSQRFTVWSSRAESDQIPMFTSADARHIAVINRNSAVQSRANGEVGRDGHRSTFRLRPSAGPSRPVGPVFDTDGVN